MCQGYLAESHFGFCNVAFNFVLWRYILTSGLPSNIVMPMSFIGSACRIDKEGDIKLLLHPIHLICVCCGCRQTRVGAGLEMKMEGKMFKHDHVHNIVR